MEHKISKSKTNENKVVQINGKDRYKWKEPIFKVYDILTKWREY